MKRILITGVNSYIGTSFEKWVGKYPIQYEVDTVDMIGDAWRQKSFHGYDTVFHVAGIVHKKETADNAALYYAVNRDLTAETALKAKDDGVKQFIFLSSMSVYGLDIGTVTKNTPLKPVTNYGKSKLAAEEAILLLQNESFRVAILRPPMIYGKGCKGNYQTLSRLAQKLPFFPSVDNMRSMLYIGTLCEFVRLLVNKDDAGIFFPQNAAYVNTTDMVCKIASAHSKHIMPTKMLNPLLRLLGRRIPAVNKAFGSLTYDMVMSDYDLKYNVCDFKQSIIETEE